MSSCTFCIVKNGQIKTYSAHYTYIRDILKGYDHEKLNEVTDINTLGHSDTWIFPCVCIDFDKKTLVNTDLNGFDDFKQYLPRGWGYKQIR